MPFIWETTSDAIPREHARIGYENAIRDATVTSNSELSDFPAFSVKSATTYDKWRPGVVPSDLDIEFADPTTLDYVAIAAHTIGSEGGAIEIYDSVEGLLATVTPSDNSPIILHFDQIQSTNITLRLTTAAAAIGVVYAGRLLAMMRPIYGGHTPGVLNRQTTFQNNKSEGGQFLGRSIVRRGYAESFSWRNLAPDWYRTNFDPFVEAAREYPFFIAWRPGDYPDEVLYGWTSSDIEPINNGRRGLMDVSFDVEGLGDA